MATLIDLGRRPGAFIIGGANGHRVDHVVIASGKLLAGTVLGEVDPALPAGMLVAAPKVRNVGDGVLTVDRSVPIVTPTTQGGTYRAVLTTEAPGGGAFTIYDPFRRVVGTATVGVTFDNQIKFVISAGTTDFARGDVFRLHADPDIGVAGPWLPGAGSIAASVLLENVDATDNPVFATIVNRDFEADDKRLIWPASMTVMQKTVAIISFAARGVFVHVPKAVTDV